MQIYARDHVEVHPQKKKEVLYLAKKREKYNGLRNVMDINCEVLQQEFNKHVLFNIEDSASVQTFKSFRDDEWEEKNGKEKQKFEREHNVL